MHMWAIVQIHILLKSKIKNVILVRLLVLWKQPKGVIVVLLDKKYSLHKWTKLRCFGSKCALVYTGYMKSRQQR